MARSKEELACFGRWRECCSVTEFTLAFSPDSESRFNMGLLASGKFVKKVGLDVRFAQQVKGEFTTLCFSHSLPRDLSFECSIAARNGLMGKAASLAHEQGIAFRSCYLEDMFSLYDGDAIKRFVKARYFL